MTAFSIASVTECDVKDVEIERLLYDVYVKAGYTDPTIAKIRFSAPRVRERGELLFARNGEQGLVGMVIIARDDSPACKFARLGEVELHLLAVDPNYRTQGVGRALVQRAIAAARQSGASRILLWTQPTMRSAQQLYCKLGFERHPQRDFSDEGRRFLFLSLELSGDLIS